MEANMKGESAFKRLQDLMRDQNMDLVLLWPSANWRYLVPFAPIAVERPTFLILSQDRICAVVPEFDRLEFIAKTGLEPVFSWSDAQGPADAVRQAWEEVRGHLAQNLSVDDTMPFLYFKTLEPHIKNKPALLASQLLMELRGIKTDEEIAAIKKTAALIERVIDRASRIFKAGMTERDAEVKLRLELMEEGAGTLDYVLVQACPNSASPHHMPGPAVIKKGEPVLLDITLSKEGYYADITRQVSLGAPSEEYQKIFGIVRRAQAEAVNHVRPGIAVGDIDAAARTTIEKAGMGEFFNTRTGHGLGLEGHEPPSVWGGNKVILRPGMVFTIEPGIYLPGKFGVRIEDTVTVTNQGGQRLTESDRDLIII
jgi:Xaa-Pro dipeptidase